MKPPGKEKNNISETNHESGANAQSVANIGSLGILPLEILQMVVTDLPISSKASFNRASKGLYLFFQPEFNKTSEVDLKELLQAVVDDEREQVKKILDVNPLLLQKTPEKDTVIESKCTWQRFHAEKAFEMACKRGQFKMIKLMLPYFKKLKNGSGEALRQWKIKEVNNERNEMYKQKVRSMAETISRETFPNGAEGSRLIDKVSEETKKALVEFRNELLPKDPITLDNYPDVEQLLFDSYEIYRDVFESKPQNENKKSLFSISVIGFIQSILIPELGKAFCFGLESVVNNHQEIPEPYELLERFKQEVQRGEAIATVISEIDNLRMKDGTFFYRTDCDTQQGLGFDFYVNVLGKPKRIPLHRENIRRYLSGPIMINYIANKQLKLQCLKEDLTRGIYPDDLNSSLQPKVFYTCFQPQP